MTCLADDQGLAPALDHVCGPGRLGLAVLGAQIFQVTNMVDVHSVLRATEFAGGLEETLYQFVPGGLASGRLVVEDCRLPSFEGYAAPACYQGALAVALDSDFEHLIGPVVVLVSGLVTSVDRGDLDLELQG